MEFLLEWGYLGLFVAAFIGATVLPLSSEVLLTALLLSPDADPYLAVACASIGNWLGALTSYYIGYLGRWEWIEKFGVKREKLEKQRERVEKWGAWLALLTWVPFIGDILSVALGFYRANFPRTAFFMLIGKSGRFIVWTLLFYLTQPIFS